MRAVGDSEQSDSLWLQRHLAVSVFRLALGSCFHGLRYPVEALALPFCEVLVVPKRPLDDLYSCGKLALVGGGIETSGELIQVEVGRCRGSSVELVGNVFESDQDLVFVLWEQVHFELSVEALDGCSLRLDTGLRGGLGFTADRVVGCEEVLDRLVDHELSLPLQRFCRCSVEDLDEVLRVDFDASARLISLIECLANSSVVVE